MTSEEPEVTIWDTESTSVEPLLTTTTTSASTTSVTTRRVDLVLRLPRTGFLESILISVAVVLTLILILAAAYFYLVRKLGYFSDNPFYKRRMHYSSVQYQSVSSQRNASNLCNSERRPRPSTLYLSKTTSDENFRTALRKKAIDKRLIKKQLVVPEGVAPRAEPEPSTVGSSAKTSGADSIARNPPPAQLPRKRIEVVERTVNGDPLITTSSSAPSTTTASDNSFHTAPSAYYTPTQGDWTMEVPVYRSSKDWRCAHYSGVAPGQRITSTSVAVAAPGRV